MNNSGHCGCDGGGSGTSPFDQFLNRRNQVQFSSVDIVPTPGFGDGHLTVGGPATFDDNIVVERATSADEAYVEYLTTNVNRWYKSGLTRESTLPIARQDDFALWNYTGDEIFYSPFNTHMLIAPNQINFGLTGPVVINTINGDNTMHNILDPGFTVGITQIEAGVLSPQMILEATVVFEYRNQDPMNPPDEGFSVYLNLNALPIISANWPVSGGGTGANTYFQAKVTFRVYFTALVSSAQGGLGPHKENYYEPRL